MISYKMARRSFLRACGGSAALLVPLLRDIEARADGACRRRCASWSSTTRWARSWALWRPASGARPPRRQLHAARRAARRSSRCSSKMVMIDGLNIVTPATAAGNAGTNTHEGGMVALMTGAAGAGEDRPAGLVRGRRVDRSDPAGAIAGAGRAGVGRARTTFGSLQLAADVRSDRDEVAPRVLSYLDPLPNQTDITQGAPAALPGDAAAHRVQSRSSAARCRPGPRPPTPPACWRRS